jgi:DNA invertase Pin-like site-specific DNA recombinase
MSQTAVIYARFSSAEQAHGYSLERQITNGEKFITERGWTLGHTIKDEGKSAFHGTNRAEGSALFDFEAEAREGLHSGKVLCVENVDRLSRQGAKVAAQLIWALNSQGVDVATWQDDITYRAGNNGDMMELFSVIIKSQLAYEESLKKSKRSHDSWQKRYRKITAGEKVSTSRPPAWIVKTPEGYDLHEYRKKVLNEIYDLYIAGHGIIAIVQILNRRNEPGWAIRKDKKTGKLLPDKGWYQAYVYRLLTHRSVLGEYVTTDRNSLAAEFFPQAITAEKFNRAQEVRETKKVVSGWEGKKVSNLLTGLVSCNHCRGPAAFEDKGHNHSATYVTKNGEKRFYVGKRVVRLSCDNRRRRKGCTNAERYDYPTVEKAVLDTLIGYISEYDADPKLDLMREELAEVERHIEVSEGRLNNLLDVIADGGSKALAGKIAGIETEIDDLRKKATALSRPIIQLETKPRATSDIDLLAALRSSLDSEDLLLRHAARHQTNMALKRLVEDITITDHGGWAILIPGAVWEFTKDGVLTLHDDL